MQEQQADSDTGALENGDEKRFEVLMCGVGEDMAAGTARHAASEVCGGGEEVPEGRSRGEESGSMEELRGLMQSSLESTERIFEGCFKSAAVKLRQFQAMQAGLTVS